MIRAALVGSVAAAMCLVALDSVAQITVVPDPARTISVTGHGAVSADPDMATVGLGVFVHDADIKTAKSSVDASVQRIVDIAKAMSVREADLKTSSLNVSPAYQNDDQQTFVGYEVTRSVTVTLREIGKLEELLDRAIEAGANRGFDVSLESSRAKELRREAGALAVAAAKERASALAAELGLRLGPVRSVSESRSSYPSASGYVSGTEARFLPGQISFSFDVNVSFLLQESASKE